MVAASFLFENRQITVGSRQNQADRTGGYTRRAIKYKKMEGAIVIVIAFAAVGVIGRVFEAALYAVNLKAKPEGLVEERTVYLPELLINTD